MTEATPSGASAPATPSDEPKAPVQQGTATQDQKDAPPPQGEAKPQPEPPKPTEPVKTEPPKPEAKVEFLSKSEQLKLPEKIAEAEAEYLKGKLEQFAKTAIENKMPLAEAQKAFENNLQSFRDVAAFGDARIQAMKNSWLDQIKGDKILGGDNLNRTNQLAERALVTLFGKDFYGMIIGFVVPRFCSSSTSLTTVGFADSPTHTHIYHTPIIIVGVYNFCHLTIGNCFNVRSKR